MSQVVGLPNNSYKPITNTAWVRARLCKLLKKRCTRLATESDKVYQLLAHGRWVSPDSSTTKTDCPDIAEILLKVVLTTKNQIMLVPYVSIWYAFKCQLVPVAIAIMSKINGTAINSRVFSFPFIVSTQGCELNGTAVNSFTLKQFTTARCNQKGSIIIFQYCVPISSNFGYYLVKEITMTRD